MSINEILAAAQLQEGEELHIIDAHSGSEFLPNDKLSEMVCRSLEREGLADGILAIISVRWFWVVPERRLGIVCFIFRKRSTGAVFLVRSYFKNTSDCSALGGSATCLNPPKGDRSSVILNIPPSLKLWRTGKIYLRQPVYS